MNLSIQPCPCGKCRKVVISPIFHCQDASIDRETADEIMALQRDALRYRWLRDGNGYAPEENYARGGDDLDRLCDQGIKDELVREEKENAS